MSIRVCNVGLGLVVLAIAASGCTGAKSTGEVQKTPALATREFAIEGMTCQGCANHIVEAVKELPGVQSVEVSLEDKRAKVVADEAVAPAEKIEAAIVAAGYKAHAIAAGKTP